MQTMKKIDLLNKISNNELEDKTRVIFKEHNTECIYHKKEKRFEFIKKGDWNDYFYTFDLAELNDEVEIISDKPRFEIDDTGYIHTNNGAWKSRKMDIEFAKAINYLLEKSDKSE